MFDTTPAHLWPFRLVADLTDTPANFILLDRITVPDGEFYSRQTTTARIAIVWDEEKDARAFLVLRALHSADLLPSSIVIAKESKDCLDLMYPSDGVASTTNRYTPLASFAIKAKAAIKRFSDP